MEKYREECAKTINTRSKWDASQKPRKKKEGAGKCIMCTKVKARDANFKAAVPVSVHVVCICTVY